MDDIDFIIGALPDSRRDKINERAEAMHAEWQLNASDSIEEAERQGRKEEMRLLERTVLGLHRLLPSLTRQADIDTVYESMILVESKLHVLRVAARSWEV